MTNEAKLRDYLKRATADLRESRRRVGEMEADAREPIAIVGMACRYPGEVASPQELWRLVEEGRDAISEFPDDRGWDLDRVYNPEYTREGGFLHDVADFDAGFFGISPREALGMDPQQRLLLETSWEALEDAGIDPASLRGEPAGVFAGVMTQDYGFSPGMTEAIVSGRVAYTLGLEGPTMSVDTACSSSLVALHLASQALRGGECSLALAGGVTVIATPSIFIGMGMQDGLAADGRSKSFAEAANGAGFSEGAGMLILERLSDAQRNGHPILATIRGSATNQDGASNGITAPNGPSQERVIRQALASARLAPEEIDAVEAHGTGTTLGDPIEAGALIATYGQDREAPLMLGSIKSNIGHTQGAAGVAGVIKMVMAMREGRLPKTLHVDQPSSHVDWSAGEVELLTEERPWEPNGRPRRAGVSSFGISGSNAHVILEEAPEPDLAVDGEDGSAVGSPAATENPDEAPLPGAHLPLVLSAKSEDALHDAARRLRSHLEADPELELADVAYSLATTRSSLERRAVLTAPESVDAMDALAILAEGGTAPNLVVAKANPGGSAFLFPGQGSQWDGMALDLVEGSAVFAGYMRECEEALEPHLDWSVRDVLSGASNAPSIEQIEVVQPVLFAVMVSLAKLWRACGVDPTAVAGHSQGEIAAAHIAGGLSLDDAAHLAAVRSRIISSMAGQGGMVSVFLPPDQLESRLERWGGRVELAAVNGPTSAVVSGDRESLDELLEQCAADDVRAREIPAAIASHSAYVEPLRDEVLTALASISPRSGEIPFHSTVTGGELDTAELDAEYWYRNLRETVRFEQVTRGLLGQGNRILIEISPHPVFALAVGETVESALADPDEAAVLPTLRREEGGPERFSLSLAQAHAAGAALDWDALFAGSGAKRVPLPTYPFQRKRYWLSSEAGTGDLVAAGQASADHPLLGAAVELAEGQGTLFTGRLSLKTHPWLADHAVAGTVLLPGTAFVELALHAGERAGAPRLQELTLQAPLVLSEDAALQLQLAVAEPDAEGVREIAVHSRLQASADQELSEAPEWTCHAEGLLAPSSPNLPEPLSEWPPAGTKPIEVEYLYDSLAELGIEYGPAFQGLTAAWQNGDAIFTEVSLGAEQRDSAGHFGIHPALLDAALHGAFTQVDAAGAEAPHLPFSWSEVSLHGAGASEVRVRLKTGDGEVSLAVFDRDGAALAEVGSLVTRPVSAEALAGAKRRSESLFEVEWNEVSLAQRASEEIAVLGEGLLPEATRHEGVAALAGAIGEGEAAPTVVLFEVPIPEGDPARAALLATKAALALVQEWLAEEALGGSRLALLTRGAVPVGEGEGADPAAASLWGLLRSAQSEHPGRFGLIDTDGTEDSTAALAAALANEEEPQLALRDGVALAPRVTRLPIRSAEDAEGTTLSLDPDKTVLVTGGTGTLGSLFARHLVQEYGARHLLLISRSGANAEGAAELEAELGQLGAEVTIAPCDAADPAALKALLDSLPEEHPLGAVIHAAGALRDATMEALTDEQVEAAFAPKATAAFNLHELTKDLGLSAFVAFSSIAGTLGGPGQGNYAAANVFVDALIAKRSQEGLAATSIVWGLWAEESAMTSHLEEADLQRMARTGIEALSNDQGLALFDAALSADRSLVMGVRLNPAGLRTMASVGALPPILSGLVRTPARRPGGVALATKLAGLTEAEQEHLVLELVRGEAAGVLGHESGEEVPVQAAFKELGFDSLGAVELRNRLNLATGLRLAATTVFDYPNPEALAAHVLTQVKVGGATEQVAVKAQATDEPIAIVGMACRYPGEVGSPQELWQLVDEGRDGIAGFPDDRGWDLDRIYNDEYAREGGFIYDVGEFDAGFFGISPREAIGMDPQQRLLLEACWEALEDAGIDPTSVRGEPAGVFAGVMTQDYGFSPGMTSSIISGRVAYTLGLEGPAISIDTACSSSLVAMHLASQALRGGECALALAGGVTVLSTPSIFVGMGMQGGLAPDGRSKSFAEGADGAGFSEGVGMLLMERLSDAERNGHPILATIRGSATNQDGASNGLTAPNGPSQERVIRQALANARLTPQEVDAVEAHGTGTSLGDPIEAQALLATYGQEREEPLKLGSIKSNIGHTSAAAGVAGVIKMVMAMREGVLPRTLHAETPSSQVDWTMGAVELLTEPQRWESNGHPRRAGVSSFGISGTNAHVILEEAPDQAAAAGADASRSDATGAVGWRGPLPLALSAKSEAALEDAAKRLVAHLGDTPELGLADVAYSLATTRASLAQRAVVLAADRDELLAGLASLAKGAPASNLTVARASRGRTAFLLTGQGAQRAGMGSELYESFPVYAKALDEVIAELDPHTDRPLKELIFSEPGSNEAALLDHTTYAQPALFATEIAIYRLLESFGVKPDLLTGHSIGEIGAAYLSGVFSLEDASKLVAARGALMGALPEGGAMLAIGAAEEEVAKSLEGKESDLSIATINGPTSIVISGTEKAIEAAQAHWEEKGAKTKRLTVSHAFHSPLMEPMLEQFAEVAKSLAYSDPKIPIVSNRTGEILTADQATDPAYWVSHVREAVRFADAVSTLASQGATRLIEIGPDAVLTAMARECLADADQQPAFVATMRRERPEAEAFSGALASAHASGADLDWEAIFAGTAAKRVSLPTYPFQRKRYWIEPEAEMGSVSTVGLVDPEHPFFGAAVESPQDGSLTFTGRLSLQTHAWLGDHIIGGVALFPGTGYLELALHALSYTEAAKLAELTLQEPMILPEEGGLQLQMLVAGLGEDGMREMAVYSRPEPIEGQDQVGAGEWTCHASGLLSNEPADDPEPLPSWPPEDATPLAFESAYDRLNDFDADYGPIFHSLTAAWRIGSSSLGETVGSTTFAETALIEDQRDAAGRFCVHPALLHGVFHALLADVDIGDVDGKLDSILTFAWKDISLNATGRSELHARAHLSSEGKTTISAFDPDGTHVVTIGSVAMRPISPEQYAAAKRRGQLLLGIDWNEVSLPKRAPATDLAVVGGIELSGARQYPDIAALTTAIASGDPLPPAVLCEAPGTAASNPAGAARESTAATLRLIQEWLAEPSFNDSRLVLLTRGSVAAREGEVPNLATAAIWGLLRSAQTEYPERFTLIDADGSEGSLGALPAAIAMDGEPQLALREGAALAPRAVRLPTMLPEGDRVTYLDPDATVLITGGTGTLGALTARHLVEEQGARHLLLTSRSGMQAEGAEELKAGLEELGAEVTIASCDAADRGALASLLDSIPEEHPLGAVIHSAGAIADGMIASMEAKDLDPVFASKVDAAWNLHELTADRKISAFVMFSSIAGSLGGPGQGNYAAANVFLDALADRRRAEGLPATSIAWGRWETESAMTSGLSDADHKRMERIGIGALSEEQGLGLFETAIGSDRPLALAFHANLKGLRTLAGLGALPPMLKGIVPASAPHQATGPLLPVRLEGLSEAEQQKVTLDLVRSEIAAVLGHDSAEEIPAEDAFLDLGFDSLAAVELRNRLNLVTGLRLAADAVFDYPNSEKLATHILAQVNGEQGSAVGDSQGESTESVLA